MTRTCADCTERLFCLVVREGAYECVGLEQMAWLGGCGVSGALRVGNKTTHFESHSCPTELEMKNQPIILIFVACALITGVFVALLIGRKHRAPATNPFSP